MCDFEAGDKVLILSGKHEGEKGTVKYPFSDFGDPYLSVDLDNGTNTDIYESELNVKYIGPDKYEYAVQSVLKEGGHEFAVDNDDWVSLTEAEDEYLERLEDNSRYERAVGPTQTTYRMVKRRKAGKIEAL